MTTTMVRDSVVGDTWLQTTMQQAPPMHILGQDGQPTGDFLSGPVRLAFPNLFTPQTNKRDDGSEAQNYNATLLFPTGDHAYFALFYEKYYEVCASAFRSLWNPHTQQYNGLHSPFHDQAEKAHQYNGFTPGCVYINVSTQYKPPVVDIRRNPIVDPSAIYPGVWCIVGLNAYSFNNKKKGVSFGLQSVMKIGDDTPLGGGGADPNAHFGHLPNISAPAVAGAQVAGAYPGSAPPGASPGAPPGAPQPIARPSLPPAGGQPGHADISDLL